MFGGRENHVIKALYFRGIQENRLKFAFQQRNDKRHDKEMPVAHKNYLTDRREQHGQRQAEPKAIGKQADVEIFQREGIFYEYNLVKSLSVTFLGLPL